MHSLPPYRIDFSVSTHAFGHIRNDAKVWGMVGPYLNHLLRATHYFEGAPFVWIGLMFCYSSTTNLQLGFQRIDKQHGGLPVTIELDMEILQWADENNLELLHDIFMIASLEALIQISQKYKLSLEPSWQERARYSDIPTTVEECEDYTQAPKKRSLH